MIPSALRTGPLVLVVAAACGNVEDTSPSAADASVADASDVADGSGTPDASDTADASPPACDPTKPYGAPVLLQNVNDAAADDGDAWLSDDETHLYFTSHRGGASPSIYVASRSSTSEAFRVRAMPLIANASLGALSPDERVIYFDSRRGNNASFDIYTAQRADTNAEFGAATRVDEPTTMAPWTTVNTSNYETQPYVIPSDGAIWFTSNRDGSYGLYRATKIGGRVEQPVRMIERGFNATVSADELVIVYGTDDGRVWEARRGRTSDPFSTPREIVELTSTTPRERTSPEWLSPDGCRLYVTRERSDVAADQQIYVATRPR